MYILLEDFVLFDGMVASRALRGRRYKMIGFNVLSESPIILLHSKWTQIDWSVTFSLGYLNAVTLNFRVGRNLVVRHSLRSSAFYLLNTFKTFDKELAY